MSDELFHLFGKLGIDQMLSRLLLEKQDGVFTSQLPLFSLPLSPVESIRYMSVQIRERTDTFLLAHQKQCFLVAKAIELHPKSNAIAP